MEVLDIVVLACHVQVDLCNNESAFSVIWKVKCSEDGRKNSVRIFLDIVWSKCD